MSRLFAAVAVLACSVAFAAPASAGSTPKGLWATINVCDTPIHDNMMGVRASMPGDAEHTKMYMRFTAQYYEASKQLWSDVPEYGVSKWIYVGSGDYARREGGYTFAFDLSPGQTFTLRGAVDFKWTKRGRIIRTAHILTRSGHPNTKAADPKAYSASICQIS